MSQAIIKPMLRSTGLFWDKAETIHNWGSFHRGAMYGFGWT